MSKTALTFMTSKRISRGPARCARDCELSITMKKSVARKSPLRAACDKCHSIKTRCGRDADTVECQRCIRLGLKCSYSAPLQMGRPRLYSNTRSRSSSVTCQSARDSPRQQPIERDEVYNNTPSVYQDVDLDWDNTLLQNDQLGE